MVVIVIAANTVVPAIRSAFHDGSQLGFGGVRGGIISFDAFKPKLGS